MIEFRQIPVGVIQICCMDPGPSISAMTNVVCGLICTEGLSFQPLPNSRAAVSPVPFSAIPPLPFPPLKFSGLIDLLLASERRYIFERFASMPLYFSWEKVFIEIIRHNSRQASHLFFMIAIL